jgi:hypothetical protein
VNRSHQSVVSTARGGNRGALPFGLSPGQRPVAPRALFVHLDGDAAKEFGIYPAAIKLAELFDDWIRAYVTTLPTLAADDAKQGELPPDAGVYMLKLGKQYRIGTTSSVPRRHQDIAIGIPQKPVVVHVITTDDPSGIEAYWHRRFDSKNTNGEWFALTREDVRAFKRRRFM